MPNMTAEQVQEIIRQSDERIMRALGDLSTDERRDAAGWRERFGTAMATRGPLAGFGQEARHREINPVQFRGQDGGRDDRGIRAARVVMALMAANGDPEHAGAWAERQYGEVEGGYVQRALLAGVESGAGALIFGDTEQEIIELLRPATVFRRMNPVLYPMPNGSDTIRKQTSGSTASYTGESDDIAVSQPTVGEINMVAKTLASIIPVSMNLVRAPSASAEEFVRNDIVASMAQRFDLAAIRGTGLQNTPKGLRYWAPAANLIPVNGTVNLANVTEDLGFLIGALAQADVRMIRPGLLMNPRTEIFLMTIRDGNGNFAFRDEMLRGTLWRIPYLTTTQIPINLGGSTDESEIYLADFADVILGETEGLELMASMEASYRENNTLVSAFSRYQTVIRAIQRHDVGVRHEESVAILTAVDWGA